MKIDSDFGYLRDVLYFDMSDAVKLFFAKLMTNSGFRAHYGISDPAWENDTEAQTAIAHLEQAGFLTVARDRDRIRYVARRDGVELLPITFF